MPMQMILDFTREPERKQTMLQKEAWLEVTEMARGVGFITTVHISLTLSDALEPLQNEIDGDYDQRLYDCLWLSHFKLFLAQRQSVTFSFTFPRKDGKTEKISEIGLRLRVKAQKQVVWLGLMEDFRNES